MSGHSKWANIKRKKGANDAGKINDGVKNKRQRKVTASDENDRADGGAVAAKQLSPCEGFQFRSIPIACHFYTPISIAMPRKMPFNAPLAFFL